MDEPDYLEQAKSIAEIATKEAPHASPETHAMLACAYALIAIAERLDLFVVVAAQDQQP